LSQSMGGGGKVIKTQGTGPEKTAKEKFWSKDRLSEKKPFLQKKKEAQRGNGRSGWLIKGGRTLYHLTIPAVIGKGFWRKKGKYPPEKKKSKIC